MRAANAEAVDAMAIAAVVAPQYDANTTTAQVGAQMLFELLCLVALRKSRPGNDG
jgi:hypothetical protein